MSIQISEEEKAKHAELKQIIEDLKPKGSIKEFFTALKSAINTGAGYRINAFEADNLLLYACKSGKYSIAKRLISDFNINLNDNDNEGNSPLLILFKRINPNNNKKAPQDLVAALIEKHSANEDVLDIQILELAKKIAEKYDPKKNKASIIESCQIVINYPHFMKKKTSSPLTLAEAMQRDDFNHENYDTEPEEDSKPSSSSTPISSSSSAALEQAAFTNKDRYKNPISVAALQFYPKSDNEAAAAAPPSSNSMTPIFQSKKRPANTSLRTAKLDLSEFGLQAAYSAEDLPLLIARRDEILEQTPTIRARSLQTLEEYQSLDRMISLIIRHEEPKIYKHINALNTVNDALTAFYQKLDSAARELKAIADEHKDCEELSVDYVNAITPELKSSIDQQYLQINSQKKAISEKLQMLVHAVSLVDEEPKTRKKPKI